MSYIGSSPKVNRLRLNPRSSDPVNPAEGDLQYADGSAREEGVWVYKNSAWVKVGSDQAGLINYVTNGDAETGNTSGWSLGNVTLTSAFPSGTPTFGSGASANLSFTNTTVTPIAGTRSFLYASSAATTAGNFVASDAFTVDQADRAQVLQIAFNYQLVSGTANFSGTSSNSFGIAIYDVTAAQWIMPAGVWNLVQSSGVGKATATFQTSATSTQYRLVLFNANATSGAVSLELDRISVGPQSQVLAPAVSDWVAFSPGWGATSGTQPSIGNGTITGVWRRVGDSMEVRISLTSGSTTNYGNSGFWYFNTPSGYTIDTTKASATANGNCGIASAANASPARWLGFAFINGTNQIGVIQQNGSTGINAVWGFATPTSWSGAGNYIEITAQVPISGWSSNSVMSQDTDTRVVAARMNGTTATNATSGVATKIPYNVVNYDTHGATSIANNNYTVPVTGYYRVTGSIAISSTPTIAPGNDMSLDIYVAGSEKARVAFWQNFTSANTTQAPRLGGSAVVFCNAGEAIDLRLTMVASGTITFNNNTTRDFFQVERLSGPAVVAASENVVARASVTSAASTANTSPINFNNVEFDSHAAITTGAGTWTYRIPVSGFYDVSASAFFSSTTAALQIYINGSLSTILGTSVAATSNGIGNACIKVNAGDTIQIRPSTTVTPASYQGSLSASNYFTIKRISK